MDAFQIVLIQGCLNFPLLIQAKSSVFWFSLLLDLILIIPVFIEPTQKYSSA